MSTLDGQVAIITGAAGGIGLETAQRFIDEGAKVALVDVAEDGLKEIEDSLGDKDNYMSIVADVSDEADVKNYVKKTKEKFGSVDILFNNAGITGDQTDMVDVDVEDFETLIGINVTGVFLGMKHVLPLMMEQGNGSIINTSSVDGLRGSPRLSPYSASKHAVVGLTKSAALEVADSGVRVNSIHPSPVSTSMMENLEGDEDGAKDEFLAQIPFDRYAEASEITNLVFFLSSDDSKFITGSQYRIDGGMGAQQ